MKNVKTFGTYKSKSTYIIESVLIHNSYINSSYNEPDTISITWCECYGLKGPM